MTIDEIQEIQTNLMNLKHYNIAPNVLTKAANGLEELKSYKELDLEIPQHFTKEQSDWIKKYCIEKNKEFYNKTIDDCIKKIMQTHIHMPNDYANEITCCVKNEIKDIMNELKVGGNDGC